MAIGQSPVSSLASVCKSLTRIVNVFKNIICKFEGFVCIVYCVFLMACHQKNKITQGFKPLMGLSQGLGLIYKDILVFLKKNKKKPTLVSVLELALGYMSFYLYC